MWSWNEMPTFLPSWEQRLHEFRFLWVQKYVGEERGTICDHWNADYQWKILTNSGTRAHYLSLTRLAQFLNVCPFDNTAVEGSGKVGPVNQVNHTIWVAVVTPTDRPRSVRNRCVIELFCGVVCVVTLPFWHFCWCRGFCHRTESDLFLFSL